MEKNSCAKSGFLRPKKNRLYPYEPSKHIMVNDNSIMGRVTKIYFPIKARQICQPLRLPYQSPIIITEYFWSNDNYNNGNDKDNKNDDNNNNNNNDNNDNNNNKNKQKYKILD